MLDQMTSLSDRGYGILKTIGEDKIKTLKKKLTVTPFQPVKFGPRPIPFTLFVNSPSKFMFQDILVLRNMVNQILSKK